MSERKEWDDMTLEYRLEFIVKARNVVEDVKGDINGVVKKARLDDVVLFYREFSDGTRIVEIAYSTDIYGEPHYQVIKFMKE